MFEGLRGMLTGREAPTMENPEERKKIGEKEIRKAEEVLKKYREGKQKLNSRIIDNEQWYKLRHWEQIRESNPANDPRPASAWLFNSLAHKHADAMDNYPSPNILPREEGDTQDAQQLSKIIPAILEQNDFEQTYNNCWWDKLKSGTAVYGVYWNPDLEYGLGDVDIKAVDILNLFWEPGISDLQRSRNVFHVELRDIEVLEEQYPEENFRGGASLEVGQYIHDAHIDTTEKCVVVDWYYKKWTGGRACVHYVKFCEGKVLYATENEEGLHERGLYDHGRYPFVLDVLFLEKDSPAGFGYVDLMKDTQITIDNLAITFEKNAKWGAEPRYFVKDGMGVNEEEFSDLTRSIVHVTGDVDRLKPVETKSLPGAYLNFYQMKIEELKETSNNRDFSQGGTSNGVTAASAIAALQEAGSKTSRDMIKASYRSASMVYRFVLELIQQFYDTPRQFRITGESGNEFIEYSNANIKGGTEGSSQGLSSGRCPVFDIKIASQKSSPFSRVAQNELAKELYHMGMFNPELSDQALITLEMMDFEGKDEIIAKVAEGGTMLVQIQQMQTQMQEMAALLDQTYGSNVSGALGAGGDALGAGGDAIGTGEARGVARGKDARDASGGDALGGVARDTSSVPAGGSGGRRMTVNALGDAVQTSKMNAVDRARETAKQRSAPN